MKRNSKIILAAISAVAIATGTVAIAGGGNHRMGDRMISKLSDKLDLNEQQEANLQSLKIEIGETRDLLRGGAESDGQYLKSLITADTFDQGAALELITTKTSAMQAQGPELVAATALFLDGLNPEQKQELNELMDRFGKRGHDRHGKSD